MILGEPRRTGQSTRLVDRYIQDLFTFGRVEVRDHIDNPTCHELLLGRVKRRLENEHMLSIGMRLAIKGNVIEIIQHSQKFPVDNVIDINK